jgi:hypothetical protein
MLVGVLVVVKVAGEVAVRRGVRVIVPGREVGVIVDVGVGVVVQGGTTFITPDLVGSFANW